MRTEFDWDPNKAATNLANHNVTFDEAISVFEDPLALSTLDQFGSGGEERWVTIGMSGASRLLLVVHTHIEVSADVVYIRIISARVPTKREIRDYQDGSNG